jgi:hypothetical protein
MVQVAIGVGSYNQGQQGYVDQVVIAHNSGAGYAGVFDFDLAPVPVFSPWGVVIMVSCLLIAGATALRGRQFSRLQVESR